MKPTNVLETLRENPFVQRVRDNLNLASVNDILAKVPERWKNVVHTARQDLSGLGSSEEEIKEKCFRALKEAERCGVDAFQTQYEVFGVQSWVVGSMLPTSNKFFVAYPAGAEPDGNLYSLGCHTLEMGAERALKPKHYISVGVPTSTPSSKPLNPVFNNGSFEYFQDQAGEVVTIPTSKGGLGIAFSPNAKCGPLSILSPREVSRVRKNPKEYIPHGGFLLGTSFFMEYTKGDTPDQALDIGTNVLEAMRTGDYGSSYNRQFGFIIHGTDGTLLHAYVHLDPDLGYFDHNRFYETFHCDVQPELFCAIYSVATLASENLHNQGFRLTLLEENDLAQICKVDHNQMSQFRNVPLGLPGLLVPIPNQ